MSFLKIAQELEIFEYPSSLDAYYPIDEARVSELCTVSMIEHLQNSYNLFGDYYSDVLASFEDLQRDPVRKACMDVFSLYIRDHNAEEARKLYCPKLTGSKGSNMLGLFIHLPSVDDAYNRLTDAGLSKASAVASLQLYRIFLREVKEFRHGFLGYTPDVARWLTYCTKGEMYYPGFGGFYYQVISLPENITPYLIKNRMCAEVVPVFGNGQKIHKCGVPLGSEGATDETGAFETVFQETCDAYIGHPVRDCKVSTQEEIFYKQQWDLIFAPGVDAISMHVFFEADLSSEAVVESQKRSVAMAQRMFPDKDFKAIYCSSWLLNPAVYESLDMNSRIRKFSDSFFKFPAKSGANAVFHYAFPGVHPDLTKLPENSRLQKGLKQRILRGEYIHDTSGIILL